MWLERANFECCVFKQNPINSTGYVFNIHNFNKIIKTELDNVVVRFDQLPVNGLDIILRLFIIHTACVKEKKEKKYHGMHKSI